MKKKDLREYLVSNGAVPLKINDHMRDLFTKVRPLIILPNKVSEDDDLNTYDLMLGYNIHDVVFNSNQIFGNPNESIENLEKFLGDFLSEKIYDANPESKYHISMKEEASIPGNEKIDFEIVFSVGCLVSSLEEDVKIVSTMMGYLSGAFLRDTYYLNVLHSYNNFYLDTILIPEEIKNTFLKNKKP